MQSEDVHNAFHFYIRHSLSVLDVVPFLCQARETSE